MQTFQRSLILLLLVSAIAAPSVTAELRWSRVPGVDLATVSVGPSGVWGLDKDGKVFYGKGTYNRPGNEGSDWADVFGDLQQLDVGKGVVWGVNDQDEVYYRVGINFVNPLGTSWQKVGGKLQHVSVSPQGHVWGVNSANNIYIRTGTTTSNKGGNSWKQIPGSLKQISAGGSGVWGVNAQNEVYYRVGTYGHSGSQGSDWRKVDREMTHVSSGDGVVLGVSPEGEVFRREGVNLLTPAGRSWRRLRGSMRQVDAHDADTVWGVSRLNRVYHSQV